MPFLLKLKLSSANSFSLEESKICHLGKGKHSLVGSVGMKNLATLGYQLRRHNPLPHNAPF